MVYDELENMLKNGPEWEGKDAFQKAMGETFSGITSGANARIENLEKAQSDLQKQLTDTQAENYRLMVAATSKLDAPDTGDNGRQDEPEPVKISDLFGKGTLG